MKNRKGKGAKAQAIRTLDRQQSRKKHWRWLVKVSFTFFLLCTIVWCWVKINNPLTCPIQQVMIEGNYQHVDKQALKQTVLPYLHSNFFTVNMAGIRERLLMFPWLQSVLVWREWPNRLHIELKEQRAIAVWDNNHLMNTTGEIFEAIPSTFPDGLPHLSGPLGMHETVFKNYRAMNAMLAPVHLTINQLTLNNCLSWTMTLNNHTKLMLGQEDTMNRVARFVKAYPKLHEANPEPIEYVNLCYGHGLAVKYQG